MIFQIAENGRNKHCTVPFDSSDTTGMAQGKADLKSVKAEFSSRSALFNAASSAQKYREGKKPGKKAVFLQSLSVSRKKNHKL